MDSRLSEPSTSRDSHVELSARRTRLAAPLILLALVLVVFGRSATFDFLSWDDGYHVTQNPWLNPPSAAGLAHLWDRPYFGLYAPVAYTVFAAEAQFSRVLTSIGLTSSNSSAALQPWIFHTGSVLLHAINVLLVFRLLRRLSGATWPAVAGAALFAIQPLQVEAVSWISETRGLLSTLFSLLAIQLMLPATSSAAVPSTAKDRNTAWLAVLKGSLATICFLAALCSKPTAAVVPALVLVIAWAWRAPSTEAVAGRRMRRIAWFTLLIAWTIVGVRFAVVTSQLQHHDTLSTALPWYVRPVAALANSGFYLGKLCLPVGLAPDYGWRTPVMAVANWRYAWCMAPALLIALMVVMRRRMDRRWCAAIAIALVAVAPTIGLVPSAFQAISFVADRYFYLAMLGPALGVAMWLAGNNSASTSLAVNTLSRQQRRRMAVAPVPVVRTGGRWPVAISILALCGILSLVQVGHWRDDTSVSTRMLEVNRASFVALTQRGHWAARSGDEPTAAENYRRALAANPNYPLAWFNWGVLHLRQRQWNTAVRNFERARELDPTDVMTATNLGRALIEARRYERAVAVLASAVDREPDCALAQATLGDAYLQRREFDKASKCLNAAIALQPNLADAWYLLGCAEREQKRPTAAGTALATALKHNPQLAAAHYGLGELAVDRSDWPAAERAFGAALKIRPTFLQARFQLARAMLEQEQVAAAATEFEELISEHPRYVDPYLGLADARLRQGRPADAQTLCRAALELRPGWPLATETLARAQAADLR
jgi:tetratricopeptide (TPR) repeat protein